MLGPASSNSEKPKKKVGRSFSFNHEQEGHRRSSTASGDLRIQAMEASAIMTLSGDEAHLQKQLNGDDMQEKQQPLGDRPCSNVIKPHEVLDLA